MVARYKPVNFGFFASPDLVEPRLRSRSGMWNKYAYVGDNPVNFVDPMGLETPLICLVSPWDPQCSTQDASEYCPPGRLCIQESMTVQSEYEREEQEDYDHIDLWMFEHLGPRLFVGSLESEVGWRIASHIARNGRDHRAYLIAKTKECLASLALLGPDVYNVRVTDSSLQSFFLSPVASASTSRNTIHLSAYSEEEFFLNRQRTVLEEYYHVIEQWNTGVMNEVTYLGGLIEYGYDQHPDELAAKDFAGRNLGALQNCVGK